MQSNVFCETGTLVHINGLHKDVATVYSCPQSSYVTVRSFYVISTCIIVIIIMQLMATCRILFLTPVEDIICDLPDGGVVSYHSL